MQTLWFGLSSVQSRQSRQLLGRRGGSKRGGEEPCSVPVGAQAGRLAGRRKPKLFGATLGEIAFWNVTSLHSSQCLQEEKQRDHRRSSLFPQVLASTLQKRVALLRHSEAASSDSPCPGSHTVRLLS